MSQELEIGALIAAQVVLTALVPRLVRPLLERLASGRPGSAPAAGAVGSGRPGFERKPLQPRHAT